MKRILSLAFAFALAGTLMAGCDRNASTRPAGSGSTAAPSGSASGSASGSTSGSTSTTDPEKRTPQTPAKPGGPAGGTTPSKP